MQVAGKPYRTLWMEGSVVKIIDQTLIPFRFEICSLETVEQTARAIETMLVRGAPAIGATGALGMAQAALTAKSEQWREEIKQAAIRLKATRPTAQNLFFAIDKVLAALAPAETLAQARELALREALRLVEEDVVACEAIGQFGETLLKDGYRVLTHCNAGWLACVDWGTALSPIYKAKRGGKKLTVFSDETRPRGQGSKLTAWELGQEEIEHYVIADNAAGHFMSRKEIDFVITGADRIAANGDSANKIGTYSKAVAAYVNHIPFYIAAPMSTIDFNCPSGAQIPIEERSADEVHFTWGLDEQGKISSVRTSPLHSKARNPAFDVTPAQYISGIITEKGIFKPAVLRQLQTL